MLNNTIELDKREWVVCNICGGVGCNNCYGEKGWYKYSWST